MCRLVFLLLVFVALSNYSTVSAQLSASLNFEKKLHDFGEVNELDGPISHSFEFLNQGNESIQLTNVKASCGCTTPDWSKELILPGEKGVVTAQFNPRNRPGTFKKSLSVSSTVGKVVLYIEGYVRPKPSTPETDFPSVIGSWRLKQRTLNFGKITSTKKVSKSFTIYNEGNAPVSLLEASKLPEHLKISLVPTAIPPEEKGEIVVEYDPAIKNLLGYSIDNVVLITNDSLEAVKELNVMATIYEYFPAMTDEDYLQAPHIALSEHEFDFKSIKSGDTVSHEFTILNTGNEVLNIRSVRTNCNCVTSEIASDNVQPNDSTTLKVTFDSAGRRGIQHKSITVFSNDPRHSTVRLTVKSSVKSR